MSELNKEIGLRIKGIRELSELSLQELAQKINIDPQLLSGYEMGKNDIPVSVLHDISGVLPISMTELLTGEAAKLSVYSVVKKGEGVGVDRRQAYNYQSLAYNFANRTIDPFLITIPVKEDDDFSLNTHSGQEFHYCIEGSFQIKIAKYTIVLNEGDSIYFDSTYPHGMKALGGKPAKELVVIN